jgi:hypothetical protein
MKRLTSLTLLAASLFTLPLHSEETSVQALLPLDLPTPVNAAPAMPAVFVPSIVNSISVAQMGQPQGIMLSGGQLQGGVNFTLPVDQVITNARLVLNLKVSPAMATRNATMQLMLNGQPLGTVPLGAAESDTTRFQLDIPKRGGFESYQERVEGHKVRERSPSFGEYYAHPRLFWQSQTPVEQQHIIGAFSFELSKVVRAYIRERVVDQLAHIDINLAQGVADNLGITLTEDQRNLAPPKAVNSLKKDPALSLYAVPGGEIKGRVVGVLLNDKTRSADLLAVLQALKSRGVHAKLLYSRMGEVSADDGSTLPIAATFAGAPSLTVDAVVVPCGDIQSLLDNGDANYYLLEAYKHLKPIALAGDARQFKALLKVADKGEEGIVEGDRADSAFTDQLLNLLAAHRVWSRSSKIAAIPA